MTLSGSGIYHGAMVGREEEFSRLTEFVGILDTGFSPGVICLWSGSGVGKSRLVFELSLLRDDLNWLYVSADEVSRERTDPFMSFLSRWFEQDPGSSGEENSSRFSGIWDGLMMNLAVTTGPDDGYTQVLETLRLQENVLRSMLGLESGGSLYEELDPRSRSEHAHLAVTSLFDGLAALGPTVLVLDSVQWFSGEALGFLGGILGRRLPPTLAVITMGRPSGESGGDTFPDGGWCSRAVHMHLQGISRDSIPGFFRSVAGRCPSTALTDLIWRIAGGIPLFIQQLAGFLEDSGCIGDDNRSRALLRECMAGDTGLDLSGLFSRRLAVQSPELQEVAVAASVLGRTFDTDVLCLMVPDRKLDGLLQEGISLGIWASPAEDREYIFSHVLFRDHIYSTAEESVLTSLHAGAGSAIEELYGEYRSNIRELASHWELAGERGRAASCLREAAELARAGYRNSDATDIYRRLRNLVDDGEKCRIDLSLAGVLDSTGMWSESVDLLRSCLLSLKGCSCREDLELEAEARLLLGDILCRRGSYEEADEEIGQSRTLFSELGESGRETAARAIHGRIFRHLGRHASAASMLEDCVSLARKEGDPDLLCSVHGILGALKLQMGDPTASRHHFGEQIRLAEKHGLRRREAAALLNMLNLHRNAGELREATQCYQRLLAVSEETGDVNAVGIASNSMGSILVSRRDYDGALECFGNYLEVSRRKNSSHGIATATCNMGVACMLMGNQSRAIECFMHVIDISTGIMNRQNTAVAYANMGRLFGEMGRHECAIDCAETLMELATDIGFRSGIASAWMIMSVGLHGLGEYDKALERVDRSVALTREIREWRKLPTRLLRRARILYDSGDLSGSRGSFQEALEASLRFDQPDSAFTSRLYLTVLETGDDSGKIRESLEGIIHEAATPEQEASACYHSFVHTGNRDHGNRALELYHDILDNRLLDMAVRRVEELERELGGNLH